VPAGVEEQPPINLPHALASTCGGKVVGITVIVAADGSLKDSKVVSTAGPACDRVALEGIARYRFRAERDEYGRPVEGRFTISVRY
jgi:hypothetical protein